VSKIQNYLNVSLRSDYRSVPISNCASITDTTVVLGIYRDDLVDLEKAKRDWIN